MERNPNLLIVLKGLLNPVRLRLVYLVSIILFIECFGMVNIYAQDKESIIVTGIVKDTEGEPLTGVNVLIKGTTNGTITDIEGKYSIKAQLDALLEFSFIGFNQETIAVEGKTTLDVTLVEDIAKLSEVVVVGYGSQKAKNVTTAVATVSPEEISNLGTGSLAEALQGTTPGLSVSGGGARPGEAATLSVRQSFSGNGFGSSTPLVIIDDVIQVSDDGLPTLEQFNLLDPSEIESITVLKDASAAIYGSRASQGAIIVKTKRGKKGPVKFSYSGQYSVNDAVSHSKTMSAYEYGVFANRFLRGAGKTDSKYFYSDQELNQMKNLDYDWLDEAWSAAFAHRHSLTVNGGSDNVTYFAGVSYYDQGANLGDQDYNKWTYRAGLDAKLASNLKLNVSISGNSSNKEKSFSKISSSINDGSYASYAKDGSSADYGFLLHMPKYIPWSIDVDGEEQFVSPAIGPAQSESRLNSGRNIADWNYFATLDNGSKAVNEDFSYSANFSLTYEVPFVKGLSLKGTYAVTHSSYSGEEVQLPYFLAQANNIDNEGTHLYTENTIWNDPKEINRRSRVLYDESSAKSEQINFYLNYSRSFGLHDLSGMFAVERSGRENKHKRLIYDNPEYGFYFGTSNTAGTLSTGNSYATRGESGTLSYLGRLNYDYADKYLLQLVFRSDASTKFAPEKYWGFFPSASAGWVISEENWFKDNVSFIDFLKIRYSIGKTGKDNIKPWQWLQTYDFASDKGIQFGNDGGNLGYGYKTGKAYNRNATWDTSIKHNVGIDVVTLDNRFKVSADYYYDINKDMLISLATEAGTPISAGGAVAEENFAEIDAWGSEFSLNWQDKIHTVNYKIGVQFSFRNNEVKKWPKATNSYPSENKTMVGKSTFFPEWGYKVWKGTSQKDGILRNQQDIDNYWAYLTENADAVGGTPQFWGRNKDFIKPGMLAYQDLTGDLYEDGSVQGPDGKITEERDVAKLVDNNKTYGFTTDLALKWKGFSWSAKISTSWGGIRTIGIVNQKDRRDLMLWNRESFWTDMFDETTNPNGKYPNVSQANYFTGTSDFWQVNTFRCFVRNMKFGYTIPKSITSKVNVDRITLSLVGNNLWDFYNPYPDHYRNMYDTSYEGYPTLRTWSMNVNLTF